MTDRFPDYDVMKKRDTLSFNERTRDVIDARLATVERTDVLTERQRDTLRAVAERIVPQPEHRTSVNTTALVLDKLGENAGDGYRHYRLPPLRQAWERGLDGIDAEAQARFDTAFHHCSPERRDAILAAVENGDVQASGWGDLPVELFWSWRLIPDIVTAYYSHPSSWSAMGFGGPASPRGYVRLTTNRRDAWEAAERGDGRKPRAEVRNRHGY